MSSHILGVFRRERRQTHLTQHVRRLGRRTDGATVVEFAIVVFPFLAILFAIIEVALVFFAGQVLETATADSARLIMTGQAQNAKMDAAKFKDDVCGRLHALFDCEDGVHIDVRNYSDFEGGLALNPPSYDMDAETLDLVNFQEFAPGKQGDIVVVRIVYEWPTFVRFLGFDLSTLANGNRLLMATAAFRNEPYKLN